MLKAYISRRTVDNQLKLKTVSDDSRSAVVWDFIPTAIHDIPSNHTIPSPPAGSVSLYCEDLFANRTCAYGFKMSREF